MKKTLESSSKTTIIVMIVFILIGLVLFLHDTQGDVLSSIQAWDDQAQQTAIWVGLCSAIIIGIRLYPGSYLLYDDKGNVIPRYK